MRLHHPFTGADDRLSLERSDLRRLEELLAEAEARFVPLHELSVLVTDAGDAARLLTADELPQAPAVGEVILLGRHRECACFALEVSDPQPLAAHGQLADLREVGGRLPTEDAGLLAQARALTYWHRRHRYCGSCGATTVLAEAGYLRHCPSCGDLQHPRVDPAIIVLVADEERCLLGRHRRWETPVFSTLAGFVEPGESFEQAVRREVYEESGVQLADIRYRASQPWPFPSSLMVGFEAGPATYDVQLHDDEMAEVRWFTRQALRDGVRAGAMSVSRRHSIAWSLIADWYDRGGAGTLAELS